MREGNFANHLPLNIQPQRSRRPRSTNNAHLPGGEGKPGLGVETGFPGCAAAKRAPSQPLCYFFYSISVVRPEYTKYVLCVWQKTKNRDSSRVEGEGVYEINLGMTSASVDSLSVSKWRCDAARCGAVQSRGGRNEEDELESWRRTGSQRAAHNE